MERLKISPELYVLPYGDNYIMYLPLRSVSMLVNADTIRLLNAIESKKKIDPDLQILKDLKEIGVFDQNGANFKKSKFQPTAVTLLPSFICNLRCIYCYSEGGDKLCPIQTGKISKISIEAAKSSIDFITENALKLGNKTITVGFHGGGEPMLLSNKDFIEETVKYAKHEAQKAGLTVHISAVTNGLDIDKFDPKWLKENFDRIGLSLDGPPDIQNLQRPRRGANPDSYSGAIQAIKIFEENGISYGIRSTITKHNVYRMQEMVEHFLQITSLKNFHFEPLFECGRCETTKTEAPDPNEYIDSYLKASAYAADRGVEIYYSGINTNKISDRFCGAAGTNFFITPDEHVTTCLEACRSDEKINQPFLIGNYDKLLKRFIFDDEKIAMLSSRLVTNMPGCADCFCKFSCSGDCLIKVLKSTGNMFDISGNERCEINKSLTNSKIQKSHEKIQCV